ncbi:MAG: type II toxin-antitoxin system RelB/DinJ family antitoxin, partial [Spirochaetales bacterium]|nr:type II toxin-antitoxin system RelB/DinJ family antitoxin [Spirochaetales bacterium]
MANNAVLQVRIDGNLKREAEEIYEKIGITIADAVRMFIVRSIEDQGLPFEARAAFVGPGTLHAEGILSKYADPSKIPFEKNAWAEAVAEKYGST